MVIFFFFFGNGSKDKLGQTEVKFERFNFCKSPEEKRDERSRIRDYLQAKEDMKISKNFRYNNKNLFC